jgi:hypothetical protein
VRSAIHLAGKKCEGTQPLIEGGAPALTRNGTSPQRKRPVNWLFSTMKMEFSMFDAVTRDEPCPFEHRHGGRSGLVLHAR